MSALLLLSVALLPADAPEKANGDKEKLQGTWKVVSMVSDGKEVPADKVKAMRLVFDGNNYSLKGGDVDYRGVFLVEPGKTPKQIDTTFVGEDDKELGKARGIYELDGKRLRIAWQQDSDDRPKELASKPGSGVRSMVLERE